MPRSPLRYRLSRYLRSLIASVKPTAHSPDRNTVSHGLSLATESTP
jgi:hypothetical protein